MKEKLFGLIFGTLLLMQGWLALPVHAQSSLPVLEESYRYAVEDAVVAEPGENGDRLTAITPDNEALVWNEDKTKLLVTTWKGQTSYDLFIAPYTNTSPNEAYVVWVTAVPEVQNFCQAYVRSHPDATEAEVALRLKQYLGLNPDWQYNVFAELWVSPEDLFRPCVDPEVNDSQCELNPRRTAPQVRNVQNYTSFYSNLYLRSFRSAPGVPWTGLGYTYDWGNPETEVGASEFILVPGAGYSINRAVPTMEYCKPSDVM